MAQHRDLARRQVGQLADQPLLAVHQLLHAIDRHRGERIERDPGFPVQRGLVQEARGWLGLAVRNVAGAGMANSSRWPSSLGSPMTLIFALLLSDVPQRARSVVSPSCTTVPSSS